MQYQLKDSGDGQDALLLTLALENADTPEIPDILSFIYESRRLNTPIVSGSLLEFPYIFRLEINACLDAEQQFEQIQVANLRMKQEYAQSLQEKQG